MTSHSVLALDHEGITSQGAQTLGSYETMKRLAVRYPCRKVRIVELGIHAREETQFEYIDGHDEDVQTCPVDNHVYI